MSFNSRELAWARVQSAVITKLSRSDHTCYDLHPASLSASTAISWSLLPFLQFCLVFSSLPPSLTPHPLCVLPAARPVAAIQFHLLYNRSPTARHVPYFPLHLLLLRCSLNDLHFLRVQRDTKLTAICLHEYNLQHL